MAHHEAGGGGAEAIVGLVGGLGHLGRRHHNLGPAIGDSVHCSHVIYNS